MSDEFTTQELVRRQRTNHNTVSLLAKVGYVNVKDHGKFVGVSMKVESADGMEFWLNIKGVQKGTQKLERIQDFKDQYIWIEGQMTSYVKKGTTEVNYQVSAKPPGIRILSSREYEGLKDTRHANEVVLSGSINSVKTSSKTGNTFAQISLSYFNPSEESWNSWLAPVQCPAGTEVSEKDNATVFGTLKRKNDKFYVDAERVLVG
jgi:hypothetical protein